MFVTVLFGEDRMELFNPDCQLIHFVTNLKLRCGLDPTEQVELMDSSGTVVKLEGRERSLSRADALLTGRRSYMLLRVCSEDLSQNLLYILDYKARHQRAAEGEPRYVPLLTKTQQPEFRELLRKLSTKQRRRGRRSGPGQVPGSRARNSH